ncbi:hypothetical protein M885DRAFT_493170 [Pelagophyceae sp. CCMP2097]|nr:hypothetical protein M885DRAFT_493170 [Pelagophyceae sp. CCMP2097]
MRRAAAPWRRSLRAFAGRSGFKLGEFPTSLPPRYALEFGAGGRQSNSGLHVSLFGGTGFLGRYVTAELGQVGARVLAGNRGCEMDTRHLKVSFDHGRFYAPFFSGRDPDSIHKVIRDSEVVVNLMGKYYETKGVVPKRQNNGPWYQAYSRTNYTYHEVNVKLAREVAKQARLAGATTLIHVSALAAKPDSPSVWARTKYEGELAVREEFPGAIIIRPATLFGTEDRFLNWFAKFPGFVPLVGDGNALLQPVHVNDVAKAILKCCAKPWLYEGNTFDLAGPAEYTRREMAEFTIDITRQDRTLLDIPTSLAHVIAYLADVLPDPRWVPDDVRQEEVDVILSPDSPNKTFANLKMEPKPIEKVAFSYLHRFRKGGHFNLTGHHLSPSDIRATIEFGQGKKFGHE